MQKVLAQNSIKEDNNVSDLSKFAVKRTENAVSNTQKSTDLNAEEKQLSQSYPAKENPRQPKNNMFQKSNDLAKKQVGSPQKDVF